jgi:hypothetical protein
MIYGHQNKQKFRNDHMLPRELEKRRIRQQSIDKMQLFFLKQGSGFSMPMVASP